MNKPDEIQDVLEQLATLAPAESEKPRPAPEALARLQQEITQSDKQPTRRLIPMYSKRRYAVATLLVVLALIVAFSLPPVRAAASDFLGLFRVQKFAAVSVSPQQLALLEQVAQQGLQPGEINFTEKPGPAQQLNTVAEAKAQLGYDVRTPSNLGTPQAIHLSGPASGYLTIDVESSREIMRMVGVDPMLLSDSLDGQQVDVTIFPSAVMTWTNGVGLMQMQSPLVNYPEGVDPAVMGQALLQMLGMTEREASRLARNIDWTSTFLLPIPENLATFSEVPIDNTSGLYLQSVDGQSNSLMWQEDGVVYFLSDEDGGDDLVDIARSLD